MKLQVFSGNVWKKQKIHPKIPVDARVETRIAYGETGCFNRTCASRWSEPGAHVPAQRTKSSRSPINVQRTMQLQIAVRISSPLGARSPLARTFCPTNQGSRFIFRPTLSFSFSLSRSRSLAPSLPGSSSSLFRARSRTTSPTMLTPAHVSPSLSSPLLGGVPLRRCARRSAPPSSLVLCHLLSQAASLIAAGRFRAFCARR